MYFDQIFIEKIIPDAQIIGSCSGAHIQFAVDSRNVQPGDIFVALPGARIDGHEFVKEAFEHGAKGAMIAASKKDLLKSLSPAQLKDTCIIVVPDTLHALTTLASAWRAQFTYPVVAITGSVGKTSTKERLAQIFTYNNIPCVASAGTQNTRIGLALNMLKMRAEHKVAIFELGISRRGEMAVLAQLLKHTCGVITMIGHAHMEGLGSLADIAAEKRDIFKYFTESSIGIINGDQPILSQVGYSHPVIKFGYKTINQVQARKVQPQNTHMSFVMKLYKEKFNVLLNQPHEGSVLNALAAAAAAYLLGIPSAKIVEAIHQPIAVPGRFEERIISKNKSTLISDCYNANPESMKAALLAFHRINTKKSKLVVIGDMLELGPLAPFWHRQIGRFLRKAPSIRQVILVGNMVQWTKKTIPLGVSVDIVPNWQEAVTLLDAKMVDESMVLVKGSRGMALDNLVNHFTVAE
ncbi:UDP-N-acetylmuramoyl-tripeptide--D-alanyl-D-alanine ligase [Candidatus Dependentiae bacterium Noda2021]|nr:UDP-N-acetylmuramoyl-tripeptide--D-alanyl-D-alanine ligase [Candidatus Dependentiae bacterium Noda2021]